MIEKILSIPSIIVTKAKKRINSSDTFVYIDDNKSITKLLEDYDNIRCIFYTDGQKFFDLPLAEGVYYSFMSHFAFKLDYESKYRDSWLAIEKIFMDWKWSLISEKVSTISDDLLMY